MDYFLIALAGEEGSEETYAALRRGQELIPAPQGCHPRTLSEMRPDREIPAGERPMALLHVEDVGFVASCQIFTTYDELHPKPKRRRTIHMRRGSLAPFENTVPVRSLAPRHDRPAQITPRQLERGVLRIDRAFFEAAVELGGTRPSRPVRKSARVPAASGSRPLSPARSPVPEARELRPNGSQTDEHARSRKPRAEHTPAYGARKAGQYAREEYLEAIKRWAAPARRWLGLGDVQEDDEAFEKRVRALDKAEERYGAGARGEEAVGYLLERIGLGYFVFHDLEIKDRYGKVRRNVDHVVIGPGGIFAVETKSLFGTPLVSTPGEIARHPGYKDAEKDLNGAIDQARKGAAFVDSLLGLRHGTVQPLVCVFRGFVVGDGFVEGDLRNARVHVLSSVRLLNHIRACPDYLPQSESHALADSLRDREGQG